MPMVSQRRIYECDFGAQRGVELAGRRPALVVSEDAHNSSSPSVLVVPTTQGHVDPKYIGYYPQLESLGTRASSRNLRTVDKTLLGSSIGSATHPEIRGVLRRGFWPYLEDFLLNWETPSPRLCPGTVHQGLIPNHRGEVEESWFLILAHNDANQFATVVKVDRKPVGQSKLRLPLTALDGPHDMAGYSHDVQAVDLNEAFRGSTSSSYKGRVDRGSLKRTVENIMRLTKHSPP